MVVERVIAGVAVGLDTVPAIQFALTTLTEVTVPPPVGLMYFSPVVCAESATIIYQSVHTGRRVLLVPERTNISHFVVRGFACTDL
jgi:hypothetical protein